MTLRDAATSARRIPPRGDADQRAAGRRGAARRADRRRQSWRRRSARRTAVASPRTSSSCRCCAPDSGCSTPCWSSCRARASATSACSATKRRRSRRSTTRSCRTIWRQLRADDRPDAGHRRQRGLGLDMLTAPARATSASSASSRRRRVALVERHYPDVPIYTPVVDRGLNAQQVHRARPWRFRRPAVRDT